MDGEESRQLPLGQLSLLALGLGVVTGLGAVAFRDLIGLIHNLLFTGHALIHYDANVFTAPAPWGPLVILVPALGAVGVTFLVTDFAPEAKGHGVPEVMDAIYYKSGVIRPVVALVKSLASAIAIGSGSSMRAVRRASFAARRKARPTFAAVVVTDLRVCLALIAFLQ
jgi:CIC family chloride channel protein